MISTTFEKFSSLAETGVIVPVYKEVLADLETPVSVLARFADDENLFLLESVEGGERIGRFSFLGVNPRGLFQVRDGRARFIDATGAGQELNHQQYPLDALRQLISGKSVARDSELPPLPGGAVGYLGYEAAGMFERLPAPVTAPETPDAEFMLTDEIIAFDNLRHTMKIIVCVHTDEFSSRQAAYDHGVAAVEKIAAKLAAPVPPRPELQPRLQKTLISSVPDHDHYLRMVEKAREHIRCGDIIQVVLSRRFTTSCELPAFDLYRALRLVNPSPYNFFLKLGETTLAGSSPETLVRLTGSNASIRPIAGTRPRGRDEAADRRLADELLRDDKERAEHLMLVDLARNDLGRTALPGSVQVRSFMNVERYSHVMHLVSDVSSVLRPDADALELLRTIFPAGTLSGAPKIRAMEIISELEPASRGIYGGAVGYLSYDGNMDMAITIRTMEMRHGKLYIQAGAGIVADSDPEHEYTETANKAAALFRALEIANGNLSLV